MRTEQRTVYVTDDGAEFNTEQEATRHEELVDRCNQIEALIGPRVVDDAKLTFANGGGYVQRDAEQVKNARTLFRSLWRTLYEDGVSVDPLPRPANRLQFRLQSIDRLDREWGQPAFTLGGGSLTPWIEPEPLTAVKPCLPEQKRHP